MAYLRGYDGLIYYSTTSIPTASSAEVACVEEWDLNPRMTALETTTLKDFSQSYRAGLRTATGSLRALLYKLEPGEPTRQTAIAFLNHLVSIDGQESSDPVFLRLGLVDMNGASGTLDLRAWLTDIRLSSQPADLVLLTCQFTVQGGSELEQAGASFIGIDAP